MNCQLTAFHHNRSSQSFSLCPIPSPFFFFLYINCLYLAAILLAHDAYSPPLFFQSVCVCVCVKCVCSVSNDLDNRYTRRQRKREASPRTRGSLLQGAEETKKKRNKFFGSFLFFSLPRWLQTKSIDGFLRRRRDIQKSTRVSLLFLLFLQIDLECT